ncbi:MAG TPA: MlaD family protein [Nocardioides sp.]|nr:MlaD family protein [Nocardioides sp.]
MLSSRARALLATVVVAVLAAVGAVVGIGALPDVTTARLPGAAGGDRTYPVEARFRDALDLVPNSTVRVADVPVGRVTAIDVGRDDHGYVAVAELEIDDDMQLPAGTVATIRSTSLLGEKYVELIAPAHGSGSLRDSGVIPLTRTTQDVEVEQLLSSLGALLNGGGLQQLATITQEFATALDGREQDTRALLEDLDAIVGSLDRGRPALLSALRSTARLNRVLAAQHEVLARAVTDLDPATGVLADQVADLHRALRSLRLLGQRATHVIRDSTDATVDDLAALAPVAREVGKVADLIPENLTLLVTYPFADTAVPAFSGAYGAVKGSVVLDLKQLLALVVPTETDPDAPFDPGTGTPPTDTAPSTPAAPTLPDPGVTDLVGGLLDLLSPRTGAAR